MKFFVTVKEVHTSGLIVEASSKEDAIAKANSLLESEIFPAEYSHTLGIGEDDVEQIKEE